jgi:hypothetical protein
VLSQNLEKEKNINKKKKKIENKYKQKKKIAPVYILLVLVSSLAYPIPFGSIRGLEVFFFSR